MRQFIADEFPDSKGCINIEGKKFHYLSSVLRLVPGDMVYVRLPDGKLQNMTLAKLDSSKKRIILQIAGDAVESEDFHAAPLQQKLSKEIWLFMFIAKPSKMDLIVRQAVECGVSRIIPVAGAFCQSGPVEAAKKRSNSKDERLDRIITEARQQSGSAVDTVVEKCLTVKEACDLWLNNSEVKDENIAVVLYEQTAGTKSIHEALGNVALNDSGKIKKAAIAVGAEGGISPDEIQLMESAGFIPVHFDTNILRCETAALYGIAAVQTAIQEADKWQLKESRS